MSQSVRTMIAIAIAALLLSCNRETPPDGQPIIRNGAAVDAARLMTAAGEELFWRYDPELPRHWIRYAATGELAREVQTTDPDKPYSITGAPRVVKDKVIIGNGGAEFGVRGYVTRSHSLADSHLVFTRRAPRIVS